MYLSKAIYSHPSHKRKPIEERTTSDVIMNSSITTEGYFTVIFENLSHDYSARFELKVDSTANLEMISKPTQILANNTR